MSLGGFFAEMVQSGALLVAMPLAVVAGLVSFLSPCILPLVPGYLGYVSGLADPIGENSKFGRYTNFANLMGLAAIAVPGGFGPSGRPAGVTLVGPGFSDDALAPFAAAAALRTALGQRDMLVDHVATLAEGEEAIIADVFKRGLLWLITALLPVCWRPAPQSLFAIRRHRRG